MLVLLNETMFARPYFKLILSYAILLVVANAPVTAKLGEKLVAENDEMEQGKMMDLEPSTILNTINKDSVRTLRDNYVDYIE